MLGFFCRSLVNGNTGAAAHRCDTHDKQRGIITVAAADLEDFATIEQMASN